MRVRPRPERRPRRWPWLLLLLALPLHAAAEVLARVESGTLRGRLEQGLVVFRGVPYGADTAPRRFRAALPPPRWHGVREAVAAGPSCPQPRGSAAVGPVSEDCLQLNLWTPGLRDGAMRPVIVYFHGGAYNAGSVHAPLYDGATLAREGDAVVVTVNHRLHGLGYLYLAGLDGARYPESGNVGMLDLVQALRWVRRHAREFGGDPERVTLFGQSGGGAKCATLMAMPAARGLFQRVWTMSGQQLSGRPRALADASAAAALARAGLAPGQVRQLETLPLDRLLDALAADASWTPVVDGTVLPRDPFLPDAAPQSAALPMVLGNTLDETTNLIGDRDPATFELDWPDLPQALQRHVAPFIGDLAPEAIVARYRHWYPHADASAVFFAATTAARSWKGMLLEAEARARQGGPTWTYYLHWQSPHAGGRYGAPHTLDIPLLFGTLDHSPYSAADPAAAAPIAAALRAAFLRFAADGDPNGPGLPRWPHFDLRRRAALIFDAPAPRVEFDPRGPERRLFAPVAYRQPGT